MQYLQNVLGIQTSYYKVSFPSIPNYINARYLLQAAELESVPVIFVHPREKMDAIDNVKKHMDRIQTETGRSVILVPDSLSSRQKDFLLKEHIPFVVDGKQIYLPFLAVYLQQKGDAEKSDIEELLPSTQLLLLYYIYKGCGEMIASEAAKDLELSAMSISRAVRQLEESELIRTEKRGVQKIVVSDDAPWELFEKAKPFLRSPVKRTVFIDKEQMNEQLLLSGYSALSMLSDLNPSSVDCFAAGSISAWKNCATDNLLNSKKQCAVELWRYDPKKLSHGNCVDVLSLALAFYENEDERVEHAVDEMVMNLWREFNG